MSEQMSDFEKFEQRLKARYFLVSKPVVTTILVMAGLGTIGGAWAAAKAEVARTAEKITADDLAKLANKAKEDGAEIEKILEAAQQNRFSNVEVDGTFKVKGKIVAGEISSNVLVVRDQKNDDRVICVIEASSSGGGVVKVCHANQDSGKYSARMVATPSGGSFYANDPKGDDLARLQVEPSATGDSFIGRVHVRSDPKATFKAFQQ
jgi:hypothetical protein